MELRQDCQSYQLVKSLYSIANGGFGGTGLGKGTFTTTGGQPLIPDVKTDFIYSALAQELGLVGVSALLLVFMVFVARGMKVALRVDDGFSKLLAAGLTFGFALQTFTIVGGIVRIIPLTGITLPFVSYGGSSIVANFILLAVLLLVSHRANSGSMNKRISQVAIVSLVLLAALIVATTYWQTWASAGLAARQDNEIQRVAQFTIDRGLIVASNGKTVLAANVKKKVNGQTLYFRTYPTHGLASQIVGYSTQSRARSGLEQSQNSYLTGSNADLSTIFDTVGDRLKGTTIKGNSLELTIRPGAQWLAQHLLEGKCGAAVVLEPEDGRGVRDGVLAGLRPEPDREAERLRQVQATQEPVPARAGVAAPQPRDAGPLPARVDVQDDHRRGGARRRRLQARLDLLRPGLLHRVRQAGQERARPVGPGGVRHGELRRGLPALDQRRLLQHRQGARREADPRGGEEVRLLLRAAARDARRHALGLRAST